MREDVTLITPRWIANRDQPSGPEPVCYFASTGSNTQALVVWIGEESYTIPVRVGDPDGDLVEFVPGVGIKVWTNMRAYGLERLGRGTWKVTPSLFVPGVLHAFLVLRDVPDHELINDVDGERFLNWCRGAMRMGGGFVVTMGEAGLRADAENFALMRPMLEELLKKYPRYEALGVE